MGMGSGGGSGMGSGSGGSGMRKFIFISSRFYMYSATSLQQPPMGQQKSGCCREVTTVERSNI